MDYRRKAKQPPEGVLKMTNITANKNDSSELLYSTPYADPRDIQPVPRPRSYVENTDSNSRKSVGKQVSLTGVDNVKKPPLVNRSVSQDARNESKSSKSMGLNHSYSLQSEEQIDIGSSDSLRNITNSNAKGKRASDSVLVTSFTPISNRKPMPLPSSKESSTPIPATRKSKVVLGDYTQPPDSITSEWAKAPTLRPDEYSEPFELLGAKKEGEEINREKLEESTVPSNSSSEVYMIAKTVEPDVKPSENTGGVKPAVRRKSSSKSNGPNKSNSSDNISKDMSSTEDTKTPKTNQPANSVSPAHIVSPSSSEPVYESNYEAPWNSEMLQKTLEEKMKLAERQGNKKSPPHTQLQPSTVFPDIDMQSSYEEPWDTPARKKAFADRIKKASGDMTHTVLPQNFVNKGASSAFDEGDTYEAPWDLKPESKALSRILSGGVPEDFEDTKPEFAPGDRDSPTRQSSTYKVIMKERNPYTEVLVGESVDPAVSLEHQSWYHGNISRIEAEHLLKICKHGSYLVRASETQKNAYSLSLKSTNGLVAHLRISFKDGYILGENSKPFRTVPSMIDHYTYHKLPIKGLEHTTLAHPIPVDTL